MYGEGSGGVMVAGNGDDDDQDERSALAMATRIQKLAIFQEGRCKVALSTSQVQLEVLAARSSIRFWECRPCRFALNVLSLCIGWIPMRIH